MENNIDMKEVLKNLEKDFLNPELIRDNKLFFIDKDKKYRAKMPSQENLSDATDCYNREYIKLIQQGNTMFEKTLIKVLKEKQDIDVNEMQEQANKIELEMIQNHIEASSKRDSEKKAIDKLEKEYEDLKNKRMDIILERAKYLSPAIEIKAKDEYYKFLTSSCVEEFKKDDNKENWVLVWNSYNDYKKDRSNLAYIALGKLTELMINV